MVYTEYNGKKLNKSAIEFFDKLAYHESTDNYRLVNKGSKYMGRYQVDTELMSDLKWYENGEFIKEAKGKWNLNSKKDFLESPGAQDDLIMKSMSERWKNLDKYLKNRVQKGILDYVCKEIFISSGVQFVTPGGKPLSAEKIKKVYQNKKNKELGDIRGKKFLVTISGLLVGCSAILKLKQ